MAHKPIPQPSARTFTVAELVEQAHSGRIRIPQFQRPLRWKWEDVRRLFDSIAKGYPVGSLLLWKRPAEAESVHLGALDIEAPAMQDAYFVVDGQQRLTSLASALRPTSLARGDFDLAYDLTAQDFVRVPKQEAAQIIPLPVLFDLKKLLKWGADHPEVREQIDDAAQVTESLRQYEIPAYIVEQQDENVLRDIFDRMNNYGKRLSRAEVFAALHPGAESRGEAAWFERIVDEIEVRLDFGRLDGDTVLKAILARRGHDVTRQIRDEFKSTVADRDFGPESEDDAYREGGEALKRAVQFLVEIGVPHFALLPYRHLLIVLTRYFAFFPSPSPRNCELLRRWFWRASLIGPYVYAGSWNQALRTLAGLVVKADETGSTQRLLEETERTKSAFRMPNLEKFRTNQAHSRVALCALWALGPRSFVDGTSYTREALADRLDAQTSARSVLDHCVPAPPEPMRTWLANWYFSLESVAPTPGAMVPASEYEQILATHAIGFDFGSPSEAPEAFLAKRQQRVYEIVTEFVARGAELDFEDTPPLADLDFDEEEPDEAVES